MFDVPILLLVYNRPDKIPTLIESISIVQPKRLYVFADGPKEKDEQDEVRCLKVRRSLEDLITWECKIYTLYMKENLGCGLGPAKGITWFFNNEKEGIVLEDDCLPHIDFFYYCKELLKFYRYNKNIYFIGGTNFQDGLCYGESSYYFSAGNQGTWGWASWRRAWIGFNYWLSDIDNKTFDRILKSYFTDTRQRNYWRRIFLKVKNDQYNNSCWDYQFYFKVWKANGLAVIPNVNLVTNTGFDNNATHTQDINNTFANIKSHSILPLIHPVNQMQNKVADLYLHKVHIEPLDYKYSYFIWLIKMTLRPIKFFFKQNIDRLSIK